jgi:hypothetical protein
MTTLEILEEARAIQTLGLCVGTFGRRIDGTGCQPNDPAAVAHCARGSVCRAGGFEPDTEQERRALEVLAASLPADWFPHHDVRLRVASFSNCLGKIAVLALFDRAIARQRTLESLLASEPSSSRSEAKLRTADPVI